MAAANTDKFMLVGNPGTATSLSAPGYTVGNTSITVGSTTNYPTTTGVCFSIYETETVAGETQMVAGSYNEYYGTVASGTSITNVTHVSGSGADKNYSAGASTIVTIMVSAGRENRLVEGMLVSHDQDGTLKDNAVVTANITDANVTAAKLATDAVETAKIKNGAVTGEKLNLTDIYQYDEITSPFSTASTTSVQVTGLSITFTVPAGGANYMLTFYSPALYNSGTNYSTIEVWDGTVGSGTIILSVGTFGTNGTALPVMAQKKIALTAGSHTLNVGVKASAGTVNVHAGSTNTTNLTVTRFV